MLFAVFLQNFCSLDMGQNIFSNQIAGFFINHISRTNQWNSLIFCIYGTNLHKLKNWSKNFWVGMVKNGCGQSGHGTLKLTVSREWIDGMNWFFVYWCKFRKTKSYFNDFWVGVVKNMAWPFSSWDPRMCCILRMRVWIKLIFCMLTVRQ